MDNIILFFDGEEYNYPRFFANWIIPCFLFFNGKIVCKKRIRNVVKYGIAIWYTQLVFRNPPKTVGVSSDFIVIILLYITVW